MADDQDPTARAAINALRDCVSIMEFYTERVPELEFHKEWREALDNAGYVLTHGSETKLIASLLDTYGTAR